MIIVGAKGLAKQIITSIPNEEHPNLHFFDDQDLSKTKFLGFPIVNDFEYVKKLFSIDKRFIIAVGNPSLRKKLFERFNDNGGIFHTIISKNSSVSIYETNIGPGSIILENAIVESFVNIKGGSLINIGAKICHDSSVGSFCEIGPGAIVTGSCNVGDSCSIGANATLIPNITIGRNSLIAAGAVVTKHVPANTMVAGVPARIIKTL